MRLFLLCTLVCSLLTSLAAAHDTWVETNTSIVRKGELVHVDLKLGNHGNEHRDFKLASKISLDKCELSVISPEGQSTDMKPKMADIGYTATEGYWTGRYVTKSEGLYIVSHTCESKHGTTRGIKSAKSFFVVSQKLDAVPESSQGFDKPQGHPFELVPQTNPVTAMGPGQPIRVRVLYEGQPVPEARVSFIPRGVQLAEGFDKEYEQLADKEGVATFTPREGNLYLIVSHHHADDQKGAGYDKTHYSAAITINVPQLCPHCIKALTTQK
jgi:uncharacterized GH25 family protein